MSRALSHGVTATRTDTVFHLWAPAACSVEVALYDDWDDLQRTCHPLQQLGHGEWSLHIDRDLHGIYYTYLLTHDDGNTYEIVDPWAVGAGPNSKKGLIVDLTRTDPDGWFGHKRPDPIHPNQVILYELHVRDYTIDPSSGVKHKGLYLGLSEGDTHCTSAETRMTTGLSHLKELGITHVHLMPVSDFQTVDEIKRDTYNWGYDPVLFNVPEGSYATTAIGTARISEFKIMVKALHEQGLAVVLDVVYNHTFTAHNSNFNRIAPGVFHRMTDDGHFGNGSGCGNEIATEHPKVRQFIVESLTYWMEEYQVDGFRFDLMGLYDLETLETIHATLRKYNPHILLYGEPWIGGDSVLEEFKRLTKGKQTPIGASLFNDAFRDAVKGDNDGHGKGAIHGHCDLVALQHGFVGEICYNKSISGFAKEPWEAVTYICAHDNLILRDKIKRVSNTFDTEALLRYYRLAYSMMMLSYGIPFIHEGTEFYRGKQHHHNSYNASDSVNAVHWTNKIRYRELYDYIRFLIGLRKHLHPWFQYDGNGIRKHFHFTEVTCECFSYSIDGNKGKLHVMFNLNEHAIPVTLPESRELLLFDTIHDEGVLKAMVDSVLMLPGKSTLVYVNHCPKAPVKRAKK